MDSTEIFERVKKCASRTFEVDSKYVTLQSSIDNTTGWDSLGHIKFVMEIESEFGIMFTTEDIPTLITVDIICDTIAEYSK